MAPAGVQLTLPIPQGAENILSDDALAFLAVLHRCFNKKRLELLDNRKKVQAELDKVSPSSHSALSATSKKVRAQRSTTFSEAAPFPPKGRLLADLALANSEKHRS